MSEIVLNAELAAKLRAAGPDVRFVAEDGTEIRRMWARLLRPEDPELTEEEIRARLSGPTRTLVEILADLKVKHGE